MGRQWLHSKKEVTANRRANLPIAGLLLAHVGVGLRNTQQNYPRSYPVSSEAPE